MSHSYSAASSHSSLFSSKPNFFLTTAVLASPSICDPLFRIRKSLRDYHYELMLANNKL